MDTASQLTFLTNVTLESSESDVEHKIVVPLLHLLGYEGEDWQAQSTTNGRKIDFLVNPKQVIASCPPYLVIEAKAPKKKLKQAIWQISTYMRETNAVLGLLTNGYNFLLLCNYQGKIARVAEYSSSDLVKSNHFFYKLLSKKVCLKFYSAILKSQQRVSFQFFSIISQVLSNSDELELSKDEKKFTHNNLQKSETSNQKKTEREQESMIITVFNNKGGVGKTTTTINLAAALSKMGKRVLLIDIDPQANLTTGLGVDPLNDIERQEKKDISNLLVEPRTTIEQVIVKKRWDDVQLDIIPSHIRLSEMEATLIMTPDVDRVLAKKIKKVTNDYDYIFIDPPPSFGKVNTIALMASSGVLIPTQLSPYPIRALEFVVNRAIAIDQSRDERLPILGVAVSMYNRAAVKVARDMTDEIMSVLAKNPESKNVSLYPENTWIPNLSIVSITPNKGYPLCFAEFDDDLDHREKEAAQDAFNCYMNLANHLVKTTSGVI